jgi:hypothetical protein
MSLIPAHLLLIPVDNYKILNIYNFNDIGINTLTEAGAFRKIKLFSKFPYLSSQYSLLNNEITRTKINFFYLFNQNINDLTLYGNKRQHLLIAPLTFSNSTLTFLNNKNFNKIISFNFQTNPSLNFINQISYLNYIYNLNFQNKQFSYFETSNTQIFFNENRNSDKKNSHYPIYKL